MTERETPDSIIGFWFSKQVAKCWFNSTPELDQTIKSKFELTYQIAKEGSLAHWQTSPLGCLALILLFDQFPLNMYRGLSQCFATEAQAREISDIAISKCFDEELYDKQKVFVYMPYMHSENINDQNTAIELYTRAGLKDNLRFAMHHHGIVERFGRFPHRNKILGRKNTSDEDEYLKSDKAFLG